MEPEYVMEFSVKKKWLQEHTQEGKRSLKSGWDTMIREKFALENLTNLTEKFLFQLEFRLCHFCCRTFQHQISIPEVTLPPAVSSILPATENGTTSSKGKEQDGLQPNALPSSCVNTAACASTSENSDKASFDFAYLRCCFIFCLIFLEGCKCLTNPVLCFSYDFLISTDNYCYTSSWPGSEPTVRLEWLYKYTCLFCLPIILLADILLLIS